VITHPDKVLFPDDGITKGELAAYYEAIAPVMLPHLRGRPLTMERYPAGIERQGFWQKDVSKGFPEWLERVEVPKKDGVVHHPVVTDLQSLLWTVNQNTITHHVWSSRVPDLKHPDVCVFDLDPSTDDVETVRRAAIDLRDLLEKLTLHWLMLPLNVKLLRAPEVSMLAFFPRKCSLRNHCLPSFFRVLVRSASGSV